MKIWDQLLKIRTRNDKIKNKNIQGKICVITIEEKMRDNWSRCLAMSTENLQMLWLDEAIIRLRLKAKRHEDLTRLKNIYKKLKANRRLGPKSSSIKF